MSNARSFRRAVKPTGRIAVSAGQKNGSIPATPVNVPDHANQRVHTFTGVTKREYFAARALQGIAVGNRGADPDKAATYAVRLADALLEALQHTQEESNDESVPSQEELENEPGVGPGEVRGVEPQGGAEDPQEDAGSDDGGDEPRSGIVLGSERPRGNGDG